MRFLRLAATVVLALSCFAIIVAQGPLTVSVDEVSGAPGRAVEVPIMVKGADGVGSMYIELLYETRVLKATGVKKGKLTRHSLLQANMDEPGRVVMALVDANGFRGDGSVALVQFQVQGGEGAAGVLLLQNLRASDAASQPPAALPTRAVNGLFRVTKGAVGIPWPALATIGIVAAGTAITFVLWRAGKLRRAEARAPVAPVVRGFKCPQCGRQVRPGERFCGECGAPLSGLPPRFAEAEQQLAVVQARYQAGELDQAAYVAELQKLMIRDDEGGWWTIRADTGKWYWYDGQQWVQRDPPSVSLAAAILVTPTAGKGLPWKWGLVGVGVLAVAAVVALVAAPVLFPSAPGKPTSAARAEATATSRPATAYLQTSSPAPSPSSSATHPAKEAMTRTPTATYTRSPTATPSPSPLPQRGRGKTMWLPLLCAGKRK